MNKHFLKGVEKSSEQGVDKEWQAYNDARYVGNYENLVRRLNTRDGADDPNDTVDPNHKEQVGR